jgi:uncharacterized protein with beta-barrel porin domain
VGVGTFAGSISNAGTITAPVQGIHVSSVAVFGTNSAGGGIVNSGTITAIGSSGIGISVNAVSTFFGGITNSGTITASRTAINVSAATFVGNIVNSGTGTISATGPTSAIKVSGGTFAGVISNSGTISSSSRDAINVTVSTFNGGITNSGTISVAGAIGIRINDAGIGTFIGNIVNSGTIKVSGTSATGINAHDLQSFGGNITNSGTISTGAVGIQVDLVSTFSGSGGIVNTSTGRLIQSKTLTSSSTTNIAVGIQVDNVSTFSSGVVNAGVISASANVSGGGNATAVGINIFLVSHFAGGISNSGTITVMAASTAAAAHATGIRVYRDAMFSGGITNSGSIAAAVGISVSGNGNEIFQGGIVNQRGGTISAGEGVRISNIAQFGTLSGGIVNAGSILSNQSGVLAINVATFMGGISNSGTISAQGAGLNVQSSPTFLDGITNNGRIVSGSNDILVENVSRFAGGISNAGTLTAATSISVDNIAAFTGNISNSGTIAGRTAVSVGPNVTFAGGGAIVNSGTIIGSVSAIDVSAATSPVTINQQAGLISGQILLSANADVVNISGGTISGNIVGHGSADTINFALASGTFTYGAAYGFTGINQVNVTSGTAILDGINSATTIAVSGGNLRVGDAASPTATLTGTVDVNTAGTLSGHGTIFGAVTIDSGGTLAPGGSIGTLTVSGGPLTFHAGSTYAVTITSAGTNSRTDVIGAPGTASLTGGTVAVTTQLGAYAAHTYVILTTTGGLGGTTFAGLTVNGPYNGTMTLDYTTNPGGVDLDVSASTNTLILPPNATTNEKNVAGGINSAILSGQNLPSGFQALAGLSGNHLLSALDQLSGEAGAAFTQGAFQIGGSFLNLMVNPFLDGRFGTGGGFGPAIGYAPEQTPALSGARAAFASAMPAKAVPGDFDGRFGLWGSAFGGGGSVNGDPVVGSHTATARTYGVASGLDYKVSGNTTVGFALAGGGTNWSLDSALGGGRSDVFQAGLYGSTRSGAAYLSAALSYNFHDVTTNRNVTVAGFDQLSARFQTSGLGARLEGGYRLDTALVGITPYAAAQLQAIYLPAYGEAGSAFALNYAAQTATQTRTELGAWFDRNIALMPGTLVTLYGRAAWAHDYGDSAHASALFQALPGSNFIVNAAAAKPDRGLVTAGMTYRLTDGWSLQAKFDGEFSSTANIYSGTGVLRKTW